MAGHVRVTGTDLAFAMVRRGRGLWPGLQGVQADAVRLPFATGSFNGVFSHGVFLYFPDYAYSRGALAEMRRIAKPGARLFVADVPDLETKDAYLRARTTATTSAAPVWQSSVNGDPGHLYYDRDFFREWAADQGYQVRFSERDVPGYLNGSFRFDVLFRRAPGCYDA